MYGLYDAEGKRLLGSSNKNILKVFAKKRGLNDYTIKEGNQEPSAEAKLRATKNRLTKAVDDYMNKTVQERGYDDIKSAVSYADDVEDEVFNSEGTAAKKWRSKVYRKCYDILAEVEAGIREIPTKEELIAELPELEW